MEERGGHAGVANSAALAAAGISEATKDPPGGRLGRDRDGTPNGLLLESAMRLVADAQPRSPLTRRVAGILKAQRPLLSRCITSVGAAVNRAFADDLPANQLLADQGPLRMRDNECLQRGLL